MEEQQKELSKILGIDNGEGYSKKPASWAEIYVEIGKLKERAERPPETRYIHNIGAVPYPVEIPSAYFITEQFIRVNLSTQVNRE